MISSSKSLLYSIILKVEQQHFIIWGLLKVSNAMGGSQEGVTLKRTNFEAVAAFVGAKLVVLDLNGMSM